MGFDLEAVEQLEWRVEPRTSALLILTEETWVADLLTLAAQSGGYPIACGYLEPETMLVLGTAIATTEHHQNTQALEATRATAIDSRSPAADTRLRAVGDALRTLLRAGIIEADKAGDAIEALADAGLMAPAGGGLSGWDERS